LRRKEGMTPWNLYPKVKNKIHYKNNI
jgi:hypothetical protein